MPNSTVQVTITNTCNTSNNAANLSNSGNNPQNQIQWNPAGQTGPYVLKLPYGVFIGYESGSGTFDVDITAGGGNQPSTTLQLVTNPAAQTISNYIYLNWVNCSQLQGDPPPEIIIES